MIIYSTNTSILTLPLLIIIWCIDAYLILTSLRLLLAHFHSARANRWRSSLQPFTDPLPRALENFLSFKRDKPLPQWLPWLLAITGSLILRHLLLLIVLQSS